MLFRFIAAFLLFTFGPGAACGLWLTRSLDTPRRIVVLLGIGTAAAAVLIDILGRLGWLGAFPFIAVALTGIALATWRRGRVPSPNPWTSGDLSACAAIVALAVVTGYIVFAHRVTEDPNQIAVHGDYDSLDLIYYAAISAEASHTVPPMASYYAGRELNYAYYPELVLAMVHRFGGVPMLDIYFKYAWPTFLALGGASVFLFVRAIAPAGTALLTVALMLLAGDFSYLAAWYLPHAGINWDYVLWPTNFLSPTMETLHFNSITPSLPILFTALWGTAYGFQTRRYGWIALTGVLMGVLFQFKPFAFIVMMAAFVAAMIFAGRDWDARRRFAVTLVLSGVCALPFAYRTLRLYADRRSELRFDYFLLPFRMLMKLDLTEAFTSWANGIAPVPWLAKPILAIAATALFFAGGIGVRWLGVPPVWRAMRGRIVDDQATWRLLAWAVVAGILIPFVLVTEPYNDTLQFYQTGLYLLWIFTAVTLMALVWKNRVVGSAVVVLALAVSLPSSLHYLERRWSDNQRPPLVGLTRKETEIASYLRNQDPETTVILNDRPNDPSLLAVLSERRVVLAWGRYAVGSRDRLREVEAFFASAREPAAMLDTLSRYNVTHVVVHEDRDKIHPEVLANLRMIMGDDQVKLYGVDRLRHEKP